MTAYRQCVSTWNARARLVDGRNVAIEFRIMATITEPPRLRSMICCAQQVEMIVVGGTPAVLAAQAATRTIPIVFMVVNDPWAAGSSRRWRVRAATLRGFHLYPSSDRETAGAAKGDPAAGRHVGDSEKSGQFDQFHALEGDRAGSSIARCRSSLLEARRPKELGRAFTAMVEWRTDAVIALDDSVFIAIRAELAAHAIRSRLPLICGFREITHAGALYCYAPSLAENWYRRRLYADRILKGDRSPLISPLQRSSRFELVINLKTAKALGLEIPPTLLARADEVIE